MTAAHVRNEMHNEIGQSGNGNGVAACDSVQSGPSINWVMERVMWSNAFAQALRRKFRAVE